MKLNATRLDQALGMLAGQLELTNSPAIRLVVCGGASLIATGVVSRVTKDVDVVAMRNHVLLKAMGHESIVEKL